MSKLTITSPAGGQGSALNYQQQAAQPTTVSDIGAVINGVEMMTTGKPVQISVTGEAANSEAGSWIIIQLMDGPNPIGNAIQLEASAVSENVPYALNFIHTAEAGGHDFHLKVMDKSPGSWLFGEAGGSVFNAVELTGFKGDNGTSADVGNFIFNGNNISTNEDMIVAVNGVPGSINLSAYAGVNLQFAVGEGIGLKFPDNTIQTTAYTGGSEGPKTWTAQNSSLYQIYQAHGGVEVDLLNPTIYGENVTVVSNVTNSPTMTVTTTTELSSMFYSIWTGAEYFRTLSIDFNGQTRYFLVGNPTANENEWVLEALDGNLTTYAGNSYYVNLVYGGAPALWWNADDLNFVSENDKWQFRGAKIEYHAYSVDSGTMIGTIYIADDNGDNNVTHIETSSGNNDNGNVVLWKRSGGEQGLYAYRADSESDTVKIHWTAQVYYGTEIWD